MASGPRHAEPGSSEPAGGEVDAAPGGPGAVRPRSPDGADGPAPFAVRPRAAPGATGPPGETGPPTETGPPGETAQAALPPMTGAADEPGPPEEAAPPPATGAADEPDAPEKAALARWRWRSRLRRRPRVYRVYRVGVAVVGGLLFVAWALLSWLPGPGGIPLFLLALAVLSTEFSWARRLLVRARVAAHRFAAWSAALPLGVRLLGSVAAVGFVVVAVALGLAVVLGVPGWVPEGLALHLDRLPGVERTG
ncbi:PGPGW domain-containing protein [uncultured Pseudokineococcus sp.]|uniref:PGPGW domain-containing protein n=1 Tax=uncultured Pseudokineococcus sp. TaxID=1642928 RepID=UPI00262A0A4B|nr:PGPGW domain-containing protein [uncultured Pseudokineococcus sp.]